MALKENQHSVAVNQRFTYRSSVVHASINAEFC